MKERQKDRKLMVDNRFIKKLGMNAAILLSELLDKEQYSLQEWSITEDWFFFHQIEHIRLRTALGKGKILTARSKLISIWLLLERKWKNNNSYYKIDGEIYSKMAYPKSGEILEKEFIFEELTKEWFIFYSVGIAYEIGVEESIILSVLISKRNYFQKRWELVNWYFFNSNSEIEKSTWFKRLAQYRILWNLQEKNLIDIKIIHWNTRYYALNNEEIERLNNKNYADYFKRDDWNATGRESWNATGISEVLNNPFNTWEVQITTGGESWNTTGEDDTFTTGKKAQIQQVSNNNNNRLENTNTTPNKNKTTTTKKETLNNKNKVQQDLLACYFNLKEFHQEKKYNELCEKYSASEINTVIKRIPQECENPSGFIIWWLENGESIKTKQNQTQKVDTYEQQYPSWESLSIKKRKELYVSWKKDNEDLFESIETWIRENLIKSKDPYIYNSEGTEIVKAKLNSHVLFKTREYIYENVINDQMDLLKETE